ncbi:hypothetical protein LINGRAHAP2_LOCUS31898, partial [Linum grandiflorum]
GFHCSIASICRAFRAFASHFFGFIPNFHLLIRSLKLDCKCLDDSAISFVAHHLLQELCVHNYSDFGGDLLSEIGGKCPDLR